MKRRDFLLTMGAACAAGAAWSLRFPAVSSAGTDISLPPLPYKESDLEPVISARTVSFHYGKHTKGYYDKTAAAVAAAGFAGKSLEEIVKAAAGKDGMTSLFNNAAQAWNHTFYWQCMKHGGGGEPQGKIAKAIQKSFGTFTEFRNVFTTKAKTLFGSGWVWLSADDENNLSLDALSNAGTPLTENLRPVLCIDVWEHAYYLDYQNRRAAYVDGFMDKLVNWDFVASRLV